MKAEPFIKLNSIGFCFSLPIQKSMGRSLEYRILRGNINMKTEKELKAFYGTQVVPLVNKFSPDIKKASNIYKISYFIFSAVIFAIIVFERHNISALINKHNGRGFKSILWVSALITMPVIWIINQKYQSSLAKVRNILTRKIICFANEGAEYIADDGIMEPAFEISGIFRKPLGEFASTNLIRIEADNIGCKFSWINVSFGGDNGFSGLFYITSYQPEFETEIFILPSETYKSFGRTKVKIDKNRPPVMHLEDSAFGQEFTVYASEPDKAEKILPCLSAQIIRLKKSTQNNVYVSFLRGYMFVCMSFKQNMFDAMNTSKNFEDFEKQYRLLEIPFSLVEDFALAEIISKLAIVSTESI